MTTRLAVMAVLAGLTRLAPAQEGRWEGQVRTAEQELILIIDLDTNDKRRWIGQLSIQPGADGLMLEGLAVDGDIVSFRLPFPGKPEFRMKLNEASGTMEGSGPGPNGDIRLALERSGAARIVPPPPSSPLSADIEGVWSGALTGTPAYRLELTLKNDDDGKGTATLVSLDQNGATLPATWISQSGEKIAFEIRPIRATFTGKLNEARNEMTGNWSQGDRTSSLAFKRGTR